MGAAHPLRIGVAAIASAGLMAGCASMTDGQGSRRADEGGTIRDQGLRDKAEAIQQISQPQAPRSPLAQTVADRQFQTGHLEVQASPETTAEQPADDSIVQNTVWATEYLNIRSGPSASLPKIGMLKPGQQVEPTSRTANGYQQIVFQGRTRWVQAKYLTTTRPTGGASADSFRASPQAAIATPASTPSAAASASAATGATPVLRGVYLTSGTEQAPAVRELSLARASVVARSSNVSTRSAVKRIVYATVNLNVRAGAGTSSAVIGTLSVGDHVGRRGASVNGWTPVTYLGRAGWIKSSLLSTSRPVVSRPSAPVAVKRIVYATANVNVRAGAGTSSAVIGTLSVGDHVGRRGASVNGWTPVSYQGRAAWVSAAYLSTSRPAVSRPSAPVAVKRIVYATANVNVRSGAGAGYRSLGVMSLGDYVGTRGASVNGWTPVTYLGKAGWIKSSLLSTSRPRIPDSDGSAPVKRIVYATANVNVRSGAGAGYRSLGVMSLGDYVGTRGAEVDGWTPVTYLGKAGWIKSSLLSTSRPRIPDSDDSSPSAGTILYATVGLNVRSGAGTGYQSIGTLSQGDQVSTRGAAVDGWTPVSFQGRAAWIKSSLLSTTRPAVTGGTGGSPGTVISSTPRSYSAVPDVDGVDPWGFYWGQCVSYVAWQVRSNTSYSDFENWYRGVHFGNAENWGAAARSLGITVDTTPTVGSVAWRTSGSAGHVAYVTAVHDNGTIDVSEYNYLVSEGFDTRTYVNWNSGDSSGFDGFIHF